MKILILTIAFLLPVQANPDQPATSQPADVVDVDKQWLAARRELRAGHVLEAIRMLEELSETAPNNIKVTQSLAEAWEKNRNKTRAGELYVKLGDLCMKDHRYASAIEAWKHAKNLGIELPALHWRTAQGYFAMNIPLGKIRIEKFTNIEPETLQGNVYVLDAVPKKLNQYWVAPEASAIYELAQARKKGLSLPEMDILEGRIWMAGGRPDKAAALYTRIEPEVPDTCQAEYYYYSAMAALALDDLGDFDRRLDRAVELEPDEYADKQIDAWLDASERCNRKGDLDGYIRYLEKTVSRKADSAGLLFRLGLAYQEASRFEDCARLWQRVLELDAHYPERERILQFLAKQ